MRVRVYKKIGILIALLFSICGVGFALNSVLTGIFPRFVTFSVDGPLIPSIFLSASNELAVDTLVQNGDARILNPSDIIIPIREGFPFCETFVGFDPRPNAIWDGTLMGGAPNNNVKLTGNSLQLTSNGENENGYVFVDIPFSSAFGLKVSFEFSSWGGTGADGFSFFMFDGSIDASSFEIGGTGGALGYTPVRFGSETNLIAKGLKGAYLGIGFDELGNFGNSRDGRNGGMENPIDGPNTPMRPLFKHSVVVRGPSDGDLSVPLRDRDRENAWKSGIDLIGPRWDSYKFIDGRIFDPASTGIYQISGSPDLFADASAFLHPDRFELDTDSFSASCPDEGFRKVFIDLNPIDVNDRSKGYTIEVQMLVNDLGLGGIRLINVFNGPINYPFPAPELLKVGFAAATGLQTNFHEIRNVTVQVSNEDQLEKPIVEPLEEEVCEGEVNTFELDVELRNDAANAFIRCLQLYYSVQEAEDVVTASGTSIPFPTPPISPASTYCPTGNCIDLLCRPERTSRPAYDNNTGQLAGQFEVLLIDEGGIEVPKVRFVPQPGYSGITTIYYTATDNFGQVSDPKPITITINPQPNPIITTLDPLVWEIQESGSIRVLLESSETNPINSYQWLRDGVAIPGATSTSYLASQAGEYAIQVTTPLNCIGVSQEAVTIRIVENINPDFQDTPLPETCADLGIIRVKINNLAITGVTQNGTVGNEKWRIVDTFGNIIFDWTFLAPGQTEIVQGDLIAGNYIFQIGDEFRSGQPGSDGKPLYRHQIPFTILPIQSPLQIAGISITPETCFGNGGSIVVNATGGEGPSSYSFTLVNQSNGSSLTPNSVTSGQATFSSVPQGVYTVEVRSSARCLVTDQATISGPSAPLSIALLDFDGISCGISDSGTISWEVTGGTPPFTMVSFQRNGSSVSSPTFTQNSGNFDFSKLIVGEYILTVRDANNCQISSSPVELIELPAPGFSVQDVTVCEGQSATLVPTIDVLSNSEPVFTWINHEGTEISSNSTINGVKYTIQDDGNPATPIQLLVENLAPGDYDFTLKISGPNTCDQPDQKVKITVSPLPVIEGVEVSNLTCFQSKDGTLEVSLGAGLNLSDFLYELIGVAPPQDSNLFENLQAGIYQVKVIDKQSQCEAFVQDVEITEPNALEITSVVSKDPSCDQDNGTISFTILGGTPDYNVKINGEDLDQFEYEISGSDYLIKDLAPGTYIVEVEDSKTCKVSLASPETLTNDPLDPISVAPMKVEICEGDEAIITPIISTPGVFTVNWFKDSSATEQVTTSATPDGNGLTYVVNSTTGALTVRGLKAGDHYFFLVVSGPELCARPPFEAEVTVYDPLQASLAISDEQCFDANDGNIEVTASGADGKYEYSINGGSFSNQNVFTNLSPGLYTIEVRSANGCAFTITGEVKEVLAPITTNNPDRIRPSCDLPNGRFENLVISGGWGEYTVKWTKDSPTGAPVNGDLNGAFDLLPGTYFLTVADKNGCIEVFQYELDAASDPVYTLVPTQDVCEGDRVEIRPLHLQPSPGLPPAAFTEVRWYKGPNQTGLIQNGADPNQAGVVYTIDNSDWLNPKLYVEGLPSGIYKFYFFVVCTGVELETEVEVFPIPKVEFEPLSESCLNAADGRIKVKSGANPNFRYSINGAAEITQTQLESALFAPGIYSIVVTQQGVGCPSDQIQVEILRPSAALSIGPVTTRDPACGVANGRVEGIVSGGWAPYQVVLKSGTITISTLSSSTGSFAFTGLNPGNFTIEVLDNRACQITSNLVVLVPGPTRVDVEDLEICEGEIAVLVPSLEPPSAGATINWYFDSAKTQPIISSASPAADGKIYQIDPNGVLSITGLLHADGIKTYYSDVTGTGICPGFTASPKVRIKQLPVLNVKVDRVQCFGEKGKITLSASAGNGNFQFSLDGTNFQNSGIFEVNPGIYTAYVRSEGCVVSTTNIEVLAPASTLTVSNTQLTNPTCNDEDGQITFSFSGGYGPDYDLSLLKDGVDFRNQTVNGNTVTFTNLPAGTFTLSVYDGFCKVVSQPVSLVPIATPIVSNDDLVCEGGVIQLNPRTTQTGVTPQWTWYKDKEGTQPISNGQTEGTVTYTIDADGKLSVSGLPGKTSPYLYYLGISGNNICPPSLLEVKATVYPIPNLRVSNPSIVCDPKETVDLTKFIEGFNPNVFDYQIISPSGATLRLDEINKVSQSGDYRVSSAFKGLNCWNPNQRIRVIISDTELIPEFGYEADMGGGIFVPNSEVQIQEDILFKDQSQGKILIWNWDFGDGNSSNEQNPLHQYQVKGAYTVKLTTIDEFGCVAETQKVIIAKDDYVIIIPNAFTPDGTKNQYFKPQFRGIVGMEFFIFSTWGELLFQSNSLETGGWDGYLNGKPAIPGNYVYRAVFSTRSGDKIEKSGTFILIR
jgi:large repetitive protein